MSMKPCPFCGGEAEIWEDRVFGGFTPQCKGCPVKGGRYMKKENAIKAWNTRKPMDTIVEQIHNAGGCDGTTDYDKGWDDAIAEVEKIVKGD